MRVNYPQIFANLFEKFDLFEFNLFEICNFSRKYINFKH